MYSKYYWYDRAKYLLEKYKSKHTLPVPKDEQGLRKVASVFLFAGS